MKGTFVIDWQQTEIDGVTRPQLSAVRDGATWRWTGSAMRVDGPGRILPLGDDIERSELRHRAARSVRRFLSKAIAKKQSTSVVDESDPLFDQGFLLTDGHRSYPATFIEHAPDRDPLIMFPDGLPPVSTDLWVVRTIGEDAPIRRTNDFGGGVICFTDSTMIRTPDGVRPVDEIGEGDWVQTKDNGAQKVVWRGSRRMTGARFYAVPELRPIRIRAHALHSDEPDRDLLVSPQHRMMVKGKMAQALFNTDEVLVAAEHLVNDYSIFVDYNVDQTTYHHLMFEHHQIVWANGIESESFHPANTSLKTLDPFERERLVNYFPDLQDNLFSYGAHARRDLEKSEAAILHHAMNYRR